MESCLIYKINILGYKDQGSNDLIYKEFFIGSNKSENIFPR